MEPGPWDLSLVEGSITTPHDAERIQQIRRQSTRLVTLGACATAGGIQALRNSADVEHFARTVYASPEFISTLATSTPIAAHVAVDYELRGCPIDKRQLLEVLVASVQNRRPAIPDESVCAESKRSGKVCVTVAKGIPCLGPATHSGCGALCPGYHRGCFGCFGPSASARPAALTEVWRRLGVDDAATARVWRSYHAGSEPFAAEADRLTGREDS